MANCVLCSTELKISNTPSFGSGKLSDGGTVCTACSKKINHADPRVAFKLKKYSFSDITNLLHQKETQDQEKNLRLEEIKAQIQALQLDNISGYFGRKEINELPGILAGTETIDNIIHGTYNNGIGILVSTNRRLFFIDKGLLYGLKVEDFPLDKITSIQYETGLLLGKVKIHTSGNIATIDNVEKTSSRKFAEFVRDKLSQPKENNVVANAQPNVLDQLEKLGALKEKGILSEEEFNNEKKKLLEKL